MSAFEPKNTYWDFANTVKTERRFIFDGEAGNFLASVRAASKARAYVLKAGSRLYRAQVGSDFVERPVGDGEAETGIEEEQPLPDTRMIPDPKYIKNGGRANPSGFPYLYLADRPETALAEMRPWVGESLTLAIFEVQQDTKLVVCKFGDEDLGERLFEENPSAEKLDKCVWDDISRAFARPVNREDQENAYLPTQILAEAFKAEGFDGIVYRSGLERGTNAVLFDVRVAKVIHRFVYTLKKVRYDFEAVPNHGIYRLKDGDGQYITEMHTESPK
jgi:RES domain-containing protein